MKNLEPTSINSTYFFFAGALVSFVAGYPMTAVALMGVAAVAALVEGW